MAVRYAVATGNWSAPGTWDGGATIPGAGDVVYADNRNVTIDMDITVASLNTTNRGGATLGGTFIVASAPRTITASINAGNSHCVSLSASTGTLTVVGNVVGSNTTVSIYGITITGAGCAVQVTGNLTAGSFSAANYAIYCPAATCSGGIVVVGAVLASALSQTIYVVGLADLHITGTVTGTSTAYAVNWVPSVAKSFTVVGTVYGPYGCIAGGGFNHTITIDSVVASSIAVVNIAATLTSNGTITVSSVTSGNNSALSLAGSGVATVTGTFTSGSTTGAGVAIASGITLPGSLTINGDITGGSFSNSVYGLSISAVHTVVINGSISAPSLARGMYASSVGNITINGSISNAGTAAAGAEMVTTAARTITINGTVWAPGGLIISGNYAHTVYIQSVNGGASVIVSGAAFVALTGAGTCNIAAVTTGTQGLLTCNGTGGTFTINGNVTATRAVAVVTNASPCTLVINGNITGGTFTTGCYGLQINNVSQTIIVNGNVYGGPSGGGSTSNGNVGIHCNFNGSTITVNGDVFGCQSNATGANSGIYNILTSSVTVTGTVYASLNTTAAAHGIVNASTGALSVGGIVGSDYPNAGQTQLNYAVNMLLATSTFNTGTIQNGSGGWPAWSGRMVIDYAKTNHLKIYDTGGTLRTLGETDEDMPAIGDVRYGTSYATGTRVGTLRVPPAAAVGLGVPVDNTTGTAVWTQEALAAALSPLFAAYGS